MDFPKFDGTDARIWLDTCNSYFMMYQIPEGFKVSAATMNLLGNAAHWYQAYKLDQGWHTWEQFQQAVLSEFEINVHRDKMRELLQLKQIGTVDDYTMKFNQLVYSIKLYDPAVGGMMIVTQYILGLKEELQGPVESQLPQTVTMAATLAGVHEGVFERQKKMGKTIVPRSPAYTPFRRDTNSAMSASDVWKAQQLKEYRRANNPCFKCNAPFVPGHRCAQPAAAAQLKAMENVDTPEVLTDAMLTAITELEQGWVSDGMYLSIHAMSGTSKGQSIQIQVLMGDQTLIFLIDSGSSHSFIHSSMVARLKLPAQEVKPLLVKIADNSVMKCSKIVKGAAWWCQGNTFSHDLRVLEVGGYDGVLGMDWLQQHNPMVCDWVLKKLSFERGSHIITLQGMLPKQPDQLMPITADQLLKMESGNEVWAVAILHTLDADVPLPAGAVTMPLSSLLDKYKDVFQDPTQLPPHRAFDHAITLLPNSAPVHARPYRYSPFQKDEIEKQVAEMIANGIVSPSISPFASPVLLVKKKDNTWRFCVDYRRLNMITAKNKFPLPIVDELLDELAGTKYFSKLDLKSGYHQIRMVPEDEQKTAFKTYHGHFQFKVMPFGLTNAPATFQCLMNNMFAPYLRKFVIVFMDDILVYSSSMVAHLHHLEQVFKLLQEHKLCAKRSKCTFAVK